MARVAIGLGSNVGDRQAMLDEAVKQLSELLKNCHVSSYYESEALLPEDAPEGWDMPFLNAVLVGETKLAPEALLVELQALEKALGKHKRGHWGPREIDLDLLLYDRECRATPELTLPHPGILQRDFVLLPLAEVASDWKVPCGEYQDQSIGQLAATLFPCSTLRRLT